MSFKIRQNAFLAGARPRALMGELILLPRPRSRLGRGHLSHTSLHPTRRLRRLGLGALPQYLPLELRLVLKHCTR